MRLAAPLLLLLALAAGRPTTTQTTEAETVLVTGGLGFIGSHVVDLLLDEGYRVVVLDDASNGHNWNPRVALTVLADVSEPLGDLGPAVGRVSHVVHLAAAISVAESMSDPGKYHRVNVAGSAHVLEWARAHGARVVTASSAALYGSPAEADLPLKESQPYAGLSPYADSKFAMEELQRQASVQHGFHSTALRFFNVYGPRQDPKSPYSGVISLFLDQCCTVLGDGLQTRDFVYVGDVARAVLAALRGPPPAAFRVVNVCTGARTSILDVARLIGGAGAGAVSHAPAREGDVRHSVCDASAALAAPRVSLADGLAATRAWLAGPNATVASFAAWTRDVEHWRPEPAAFVAALRRWVRDPDAGAAAALCGPADCGSDAGVDDGYARALRAALAADPLDNPRDVFVAGAGPVGLLNALEARALGHAVVAAEKRTEYTRDVWFDLAPATAELLHRWGAGHQAVPWQLHDGTDIVSIRCQTLERLLAKALLAAGGELRLGEAVERPPPPDDADLLVVADGTRSALREQLGVGFERQTRFSGLGTAGEQQLDVPGLQHTTVIAKFAPVAGGECPALRRDAAGHVPDPFDAGFHVPHVTSVFKRFFHGHCEMQVFLGAEAAAAGLDWWPTLLDLSQRLVDLPLPDEAVLRAALVAEPRQFDIQIHRAAAVVLSEPRPALIVGDAAVTAHYRLGVGVNNAVEALPELRALLSGGDVDAVRAMARERLDELVRFELRTMYYESHCDLVVYYDELFRRNSETHEFDVVEELGAGDCWSG